MTFLSTFLSTFKQKCVECGAYRSYEGPTYIVFITGREEGLVERTEGGRGSASLIFNEIMCFIPILEAKVLHYDGSPMFSAKNQSLLWEEAKNVLQLHSYHGKCNLCKTSHFHGYKENSDGSRTFDLSYCQVLLFNSGMAFTFKFLKYMDSMITVGGLSFERATNVYNYSSGEKHSPFNDDRLQAAWFMFRVLNHVTLFPTWPRKDKSYEIDIEKLCSIVYPQLKDQIDTKWIGHKCKEIGCRNGAQ